MHRRSQLKPIRILIVFGLFLVATYPGIMLAAEITNVEAQGNLQSLNDIGCAHPDALRNIFTPADLYRGVAECIKQKDYDSAVFISALAGVYGVYDGMRVSDFTARDAPTVLLMKNFDPLSEEQKNTFMQKLSSTAGNQDSLDKLCSAIRSIGPPNYRPTYMIQHGMAAFTGGSASDGVSPDFDSDAAWKKSLNSYLHCPAP
jgi:hypothetical protein